jgi:hypothetical protein
MGYYEFNMFIHRGMRLRNLKNIILVSGIAIFTVFYPSTTYAVTLRGYLTPIIDFLDTLFPLLIGIAMIVFFWGVIKYLYAGPNEDLKKSSKRVLVAGIIGLFVVVSLGGIVKLVTDMLNLDNSSPPEPIHDFPDTEEIFQFND